MMMKVKEMVENKCLLKNGRIIFDEKECKQQRQSAIISAIYSINVSIIVAVIYCYKLVKNNANDLKEVFIAVECAYIFIIMIHVVSIILSCILLHAVYKNKWELVILWIFASIAFMALELVAIVYSNTLRDYINQEFDNWSKEESIFWLIRSILNVFPLYAVIRLYNAIRKMNKIQTQSQERTEL